MNDKKREKITDPRWSSYTREEIEKKNHTLDIGLMSKQQDGDGETDEPLDIANDVKGLLTDIQAEFDKIIALLK